MMDFYERFIVRANIKEAMAINDFLNPVEEEEILQNMKVAEYEEYILETAETVEVDEEQELAEAETGITSLYSDLSTVTSHISSDERATKKVTGSCSFVWNRPWWTQNACNGAGRAT